MRIRRLLAAMLCVVMLVSFAQYPVAAKAAEDVQAIINANKTSASSFYGIDAVNQLSLRGTTIVYVTTTILVDDTGLDHIPIEEKVNGVLYSGVPELTNTAFGEGGVFQLASSSSDSSFTTYNYLLDTISIDIMRTRYLKVSKTKEYYYPMCSLDTSGPNKMKDYINATMNSAAMAGGASSGDYALRPSVFVKGDCDLEKEFFNSASWANKGMLRIPVVKLSADDENKVSASVIEEKSANSLDLTECTYDWTVSESNKYKVLTAVRAIVMPTYYRDRGGWFEGYNPVGLSPVVEVEEKGNIKGYLLSNLAYCENIVSGFADVSTYGSSEVSTELIGSEESGSYLIGDSSSFSNKHKAHYDDDVYSGGTSNSANLLEDTWGKIMTSVLINNAMREGAYEYEPLKFSNAGVQDSIIGIEDQRMLYDLTSDVSAEYIAKLNNVVKDLLENNVCLSLRDVVILRATFNGAGLGYATASNAGVTADSQGNTPLENLIDNILKTNQGTVTIPKGQTRQLYFDEDISNNILSTLANSTGLHNAQSLFVKAIRAGNVSNILAGRIYNIRSDEQFGVSNTEKMYLATQNMLNLWYGQRRAFIVNKQGSVSFEYLIYRSSSNSTMKANTNEAYLERSLGGTRFSNTNGQVTSTQKISMGKLLLSTIRGVPTTTGTMNVTEAGTNYKIDFTADSGYLLGYNMYLIYDNADNSVSKELAEKLLTDFKTVSENKKNSGETFSLEGTPKLYHYNSFLQSLVGEHSPCSDHLCMVCNYPFFDQFTGDKNSTQASVKEYAEENYKSNTDLKMEARYLGSVLAVGLESDDASAKTLNKRGFFNPHKVNTSVLSINKEALGENMELIIVPVYSAYRLQTITNLRSKTEDVTSTGFTLFGLLEQPPVFVTQVVDTGGNAIRGFSNAIVKETGSSSGLATESVLTVNISGDLANVKRIPDKSALTNDEIETYGYNALSWASSSSSEKVSLGPVATAISIVGEEVSTEPKGAAWGTKYISSTDPSTSEVAYSKDIVCNLMAETFLDVYPQVFYPGNQESGDAGEYFTLGNGVANETEIKGVKLSISGLVSRGDSQIIGAEVQSGRNDITDKEQSKFYGKGTSLTVDGLSFTYYTYKDNHKEDETSPCKYCQMCEEINEALKDYYFTFDATGTGKAVNDDGTCGKGGLREVEYKLTFERPVGANISLDGKATARAWAWSVVTQAEHEPRENDLGMDETEVKIQFTTRLSAPELSFEKYGPLFKYSRMKYVTTLKPDEKVEYATFEEPKLDVTTGDKSSMKTDLDDFKAYSEKEKYIVPEDLLGKGSIVELTGLFDKVALEGKWTITDNFTYEGITRSNKATEFKIEAPIFEYTIDWTNKIALLAHFNKKNADLNEEIQLVVEKFNYKELMPDAKKLTDSDVQFVYRNTIKNGAKIISATVSKAGADNYTIKMTWNAKEEGTFNIDNFYVKLHGKDYKLAASEKDYPKVTVPLDWPEPIHRPKMTKGGRTYEVGKESGEVVVDYTLGLEPETTDKNFSTWVSMLLGDGTSAYPDGTAYARVNLTPNIGGCKIVGVSCNKDGTLWKTATYKDGQIKLYFEGTNKQLGELLQNGVIPIEVTLEYPEDAEEEITWSGEGIVRFTKLNGASVQQSVPIGGAQKGEDIIKANYAKSACLDWELYTELNTPYAVLTPTAPNPEEWRWDLMSGIPNTEHLSATVGADLYRVGITGRLHAIGVPQDSSVKSNNEAGKQGSELATPVTRRVLAFVVNFTDWWGEGDSQPCTLSCPGHQVCSGGGGGGASCGASANANTSNGTTVTDTATGHIDPWECPLCGWKYAGHDCVQTASATGKDAEPAQGTPGEEGYVPAKPAEGDSDSSTCTESYSHDCTWNYMFNCSTGTGYFSQKGPDSQASDAPTTENSGNDQRINLTTVTVTNGKYEKVTGSCINEDTLDKGFTSGFGCKCSQTHNMVHTKSQQKKFYIVEDSDAAVWKAIDNFYISVLSNAECIETSEYIEDVTGRKVLTSGIQFAMWRGDDSEITSMCDAGNCEPECANHLGATGRLYYTEFKNPGSQGFNLNTANYSQASKVVLEITVPTNRATAYKYIEENGDIADSIFDYVTATIYKESNGGCSDSDGCGAEGHYNSGAVTSNVEEYKNGYTGDKSTDAELTTAAALLINNWLQANQADEYYKINYIGDAVTVTYDNMFQNVTGWVYSIPGADVNLFNTTFKVGRDKIYRNHVSGVTDLKTIAAAAMDAVSICDAGSGNLYLGFSGEYAPSSADAMYIRKGTVSDFNLVQALYKGETPFDKLYNSNTNFARVSSIDKSMFRKTGNPGLTKASLTLSGEGEVLLDEEYYGPVVVDVSDNIVQTMTDGEEVKGESLLNLEIDGVTITDTNRMSLLGIKIKEDTQNMLIEDPLTMQCNYKCLFLYVGKEDKAAKIRELAKDTSLICDPPNGIEGTINPVVVMNPVAANIWTIGNNKGSTQIYEVDESHEDMRDSESRARGPAEYVVIGNTFYVWTSQIGPDEVVSDSREIEPSTESWGLGTAGDRRTGDVMKGEPHGYGGTLNTSNWVGDRYIQFSIPVSYVDMDGNTIHVQANELIYLNELPEAMSGPCYEADFADTNLQDFGIGYKFTCELSAKETTEATVTVYHFAKNKDREQGDTSVESYYANSYNWVDRMDVEATDAAIATAVFSVVGRIGDLIMTDTQDYRFSNLFWETSDRWLIPDVVKETIQVSRLNYRTRQNILMNGLAPALGSIQAGYGSTRGIVENMLNYPLQGAHNNVAEFKSTNLGLGYSAYFGITTLGSYTGKNYTSEYPKSFVDVMNGVADFRSNYLSIEPIYVLYDPDANGGNGRFFDIDLYAGSGVDYELFYDYKNVPANYTNALYTSLDDEVERSRYAVSDFAKNYSLYFNDSAQSAFTEQTYVGTSRQLILDKSSNIVVGTRSIESVPVGYNISSSTYQFTDYATVSSMPSEGGQADADYALNARRWYFNLSIPTSTVAVYPGEYDTPLAITQANEKLVKEHPNGVILCFVQAKAKGDVFTLVYNSVYPNSDLDDTGNIVARGDKVSICGKSVDYIGSPAYINDKISYVLSPYMLPVFVCDLLRTSTQDLGMQGTN